MSGVKARSEKSSGFNHTRTIIVEQKADGTFVLPNNMVQYQGLDSNINEVCVLVEGEEIITDETLCESSSVIKIEQEELEYEETAEASENSQDAESLETEAERVAAETDELGLEEDPIGLGQGKPNPSDEDLRPLSWLQDKNLLKSSCIRKMFVSKFLFLAMKMTTPAQPSQQAMRKPPQHFLKAASITPPKVASKYIKIDVPIVVTSVPVRKESVNESSSQSSEVSAEEDNEEDAELLAYAKQLQAEVQRSLEIEKNHEIETSAISNTVTYDPNVHTHVKPPHSFSCLIFMAIEESPNKALPVKEIYNWMADKFPYFRHASAGWKNSVRHNLSLNKCFRKVDRLNMGKGSLWTVDPAFRPSLLAALCKTPTATGQYESKPTTPARYAKLGPDTVIKMPPKVHLPTSSRTYSKYAGRSSSSSSLSDGGHRGRPRFAPDSSSPKDPLAKSNVPDPNLFPFLSKRLAGSEANGARKRRADADAAAAMLALAKGESGVKEGEIYIDGRPVKVKFVVERSSDGTAMLSAAEKKRNKIAESFSPDFLRCHDYAAGIQEVFDDSPDESEDYRLEDPEFIVVANEIEVGTQIELETEETQLPTNSRRPAEGRRGSR